ncbi:MAG: hypothetical protein KGM17_00640 [Sphingomonadales bacterium]|nr:hypothetical protein [Sphingomonadales bacterium]
MSAPPVDRAALAREVVVSAANVLRAAGFAREEIAAFFAQAAAQLEAHAVPDDPLTATARAFADLPPVRDLQPLVTEAHALLPLRDEVPALKQAFDLAMRAAPLLAEAQDGLRALAREAGLTLAATAAEPRGDGPVVCLEEFAGAYAGVDDLVAQLAEALVARGDREAFAFLLGHFAEHGVVITGRLQAALARGADLLG